MEDKKTGTSPPPTWSSRDWSVHPPYLAEAYKSTLARSPTRDLLPLSHSRAETTGPRFGAVVRRQHDDDLTKNGASGGVPLGERIVVTGRVLDEAGRPQPDTLIEIWQCNAAGRYIHAADQHDAPLDPNFFGAGRCVTDGDGMYEFTTIKPGAYPWGNHPNAWRPAHIHFSLFGPGYASRLITQSYFPGDPLLAFDPIYNATPEAARASLVKRFSLDATREGIALGYAFDFVLRGPNATLMED